MKKATPKAKTSLHVGDKTTVGTILGIKVNPSRKTMEITVRGHSGAVFTRRVSTAGNMYVFTD
jgi:hypothetical protein